MQEPAIRITEQDFSVAEEYAALRESGAESGAIVFFTGLVRNRTDDEDVSALELQHYSGMTENLLAGIIDDAARRWSLDGVRVTHRVGRLEPGDQIVFVGVAAAHREDAFLASEFIMDYLKVQATIWKKESRPDGDVWLDDRESDHEALTRWTAPRQGS